jgi:hypothetical protein
MLGWDGFGRNVVVRMETGPGSQVSTGTHCPSPGRGGEIAGTIDGGM